jgi:hypothetical protein
LKVETARTIHESVVRKHFVSIDRVREYLSIALSRGVLLWIDLSSLRALPTHLDDRDLGWCDPDFIFVANLRGREGCMVFVLEHQSEPDSEMPYRMARASLAFLAPSYKDPITGYRAIVMPVVLAHGRRRWNKSTKLRSLMGGIDLLPARDAGLVIQQSFVLCDLNKIGPRRVWSFPVSAPTRFFLYVLQNAAKPKFWTMLKKQKLLLEEVGREPDALQVFYNLVWYMKKVTPGMTQEMANQVGDMAGLDSEAWKPIPGTWEWRSIAKGREEGARRTLSRLLVKRFGSLSTHLLEMLGAASLDQLDAWTERFVDARSCDEVFC